MMNKHTQNLSFQCISCHQDVMFSIFDLEEGACFACETCEKQYGIRDPVLIRHIRKFEALCRQIHESEEILGNTNVGVNVGDHCVKVPYKLLLTRLNSSLDLKIGDHILSIVFRMEPTRDPITTHLRKGEEHESAI